VRLTPAPVSAASVHSALRLVVVGFDVVNSVAEPQHHLNFCRLSGQLPVIVKQRHAFREVFQRVVATLRFLVGRHQALKYAGLAPFGTQCLPTMVKQA
jgi:hypothetical protein